MKPIFLFLFFSFYIFEYASAQNPLVKVWDIRYGGLEGQELSMIIQTSDGGILIAGTSSSDVGGDKTEPTQGGLDFWIVKTDSLGNKQWDKDFGGTSQDWLYSVQQTTDGGYILGGRSTSNISGDKTESTFGDFDYWILKIDSLGNKEWDKDFGGTDTDILRAIRQTDDGGYILGGYSNSGIGGNKSKPTKGGIDYWIVRTDSIGNKLWDKDFGGLYDDYMFSLSETSDGGFILGGYSYSIASGDKSQSVWGIVGTDIDYWILKTDSLGNKLWDKDFGGYEIDKFGWMETTSDGGFILAGLSTSPVGGNKTQPVWGASGIDIDYWILKTDSFGNKQWDKDLGGTNFEDEFGNIAITLDGGFLVTGTSYSPIGGNKTENNLGQEQTWMIKTDSLGNHEWDKTAFTLGHEEFGLAIPTSDGCFIAANRSMAEMGGYKSQDAWMPWIQQDYWLVKFCDSMFIQANFVSTPNLCPGTCADFINLSLNTSTYEWHFPGANPNSSFDIQPGNICYNIPGIYDVTLIATNANGSDTLTLQNYITVFPQPAAQSITQSGDTLFAIAGSASYQWYFNGSIINGATDYYYAALSSGDYNVVATDTNGCEVEAVINNVIARLTPALSKGEGVTVFPNPVLETLTVIAPGLNVTADEISIYNVLGEKVMEVSPLSFGEGLGGEAMWIVDCRPLPPGLYYLELRADDKTFRSKFLKQ